MALKRRTDAGRKRNSGATLRDYDQVHATKLLLMLPRGLAHQALKAVAHDRLKRHLARHHNAKAYVRQTVGFPINREYGVARTTMMIKYCTEIRGPQQTVALRQPATGAGATRQGFRRSAWRDLWRVEH